MKWPFVVSSQLDDKCPDVVPAMNVRPYSPFSQVPIIKVIDKETEVKVDISFNQLTGVQSVKLIKVRVNARCPGMVRSRSW